MLRAVAAAARPAVHEQRAVHRAGARPAHGVDDEIGFLDQPVEHAPGVRAVRAAALQCERHAPP
jgi:hypothetical protein